MGRSTGPPHSVCLLCAVPTTVRLVLGLGWRGRLVFRNVGHECLGRQDHPGDRDSILDGGTGDLGRVDDALFEEVDVFLGNHIESNRVGTRVCIATTDFLDDDRTLVPGVEHDRADRLLKRTP